MNVIFMSMIGGWVIKMLENIKETLYIKEKT